MPSVVVDDLWHEFVLHTRDYAAFCTRAFGRFLHHEPASAMDTEVARSNRTTLLSVTLDLARRDEDCSPTVLPLLFRVDQALGIQDGVRYLVDCGGRGECFQVAGMVCLQHLTGPGASTSARRTHDHRQPTTDRFSKTASGTGGGTGGCGSG